MILSKANLEAIRLAIRGGISRLRNGLRIEGDGSTVGANERMVLAIGPVTYEDRLNWPERAGERIEVGPEGLMLDAAAVEAAKKSLAKDKRIIFQHIALTRVEGDEDRIGLTSVNPKGDAVTNTTRPIRTGYIDWRAIVRRIRGRGTGLRVCVNRADLMDMLEAMKAACPDHGGINPLFIEIGEGESGIILRGMNLLTRQHAVGAIGVMDTKGQWLERDGWERSVFDSGPKLIKKVGKIRRVN